MKIKIWKIPYCYISFKAIRNNVPFSIEEKGYLELDTFDVDECWHLCNWSCWTNIKPNNLFSELDVANDDVIYHNPIEDKYYLALMNGWHIENSLEEIINYCKKEHEL